MPRDWAHPFSLALACLVKIDERLGHDPGLTKSDGPPGVTLNDGCANVNAACFEASPSSPMPIPQGRIPKNVIVLMRSDRCASSIFDLPHKDR